MGGRMGTKKEEAEATEQAQETGEVTPKKTEKLRAVAKSVMGSITPKKKEPPIDLSDVINKDNSFLKGILSRLNENIEKGGLNQDEAKQIAELINNEYQKALKNDYREKAGELYEIYLKFTSKTGTTPQEIKSLIINKYKYIDLTEDDAIKIISILKKNNKLDLLKLKLNDLEEASLYLELYKRGLVTEDELIKVQGKIVIDPNDKRKIINYIYNNKNKNEIITEIIEGKIQQPLKEEYNKYKGSTLEETIKNIDEKIRYYTKLDPNVYKKEINILTTLKNDLNKIKTEIDKIYIHSEIEESLASLVKKGTEAEVEKGWLNRPFELSIIGKFLKRALGIGLVAGGIYAAHKYLQGLEEYKEAVGSGALSAGSFVGAGFRAWKKIREKEGQLGELGWRAKGRVAGGDPLFWILLATSGGLGVGAVYFGKKTAEEREKIIREKLVEFGISEKEIKELKDFVLSPNYEAVVKYLAPLIAKNLEKATTKGRLDFNKLRELLNDEKSIGTFKTTMYIKALLEIANAVKGKNGEEIDAILKGEIERMKNNGYFYNAGEAILIEYGLALQIGMEEIEQLLATKRDKFVELLKAVSEGRLAQTDAVIYATRILSNQSVDDLLLPEGEPIPPGSVFDHLDRYVMNRRTQMITNKEYIGIEDLIKKYIEIREEYQNPQFGENLRKNIGNNVIIYGDVYGAVSEIMKGNRKSEGSAYIIGEPLLAQIDERFLDDVGAVKFAQENGLIEFFRGRIKYGMCDVDAYGLVKALQNDPVFLSLKTNKEKVEWIRNNIEEVKTPEEKAKQKEEKGESKRALEHYSKKNIQLQPTYMAMGIETNVGKAEETAKEGGRAKQSEITEKTGGKVEGTKTPKKGRKSAESQPKSPQSQTQPPETKKTEKQGVEVDDDKEKN